MGWFVIKVWEHDIKKDPIKSAQAIIEYRKSTLKSFK